ncbi:F-box/kelch-repeat protein [Senna tora]|uniref:F-box/kelch-repeat protein n=1 Tax=Senna tora TaxID=362788 RepID=A0A834SLR4_9FABA|nr:F-box/kelch-repeat protein [Senna tora]
MKIIRAPQSYVPLHLVVPMLEYLPPKSLFKFCFLSKTFSSIIQQESFLSNYVITRNSITPKHDDTNPNVLYHFTLSSHRTRLALYRDGIESPCAVYDLRFGQKRNTSVLFCNGVVCFVGFHHYICLWNPLVNRSTKVTLEPSFGTVTLLVGFGYDSSTSHFKFVRVFIDNSFELPQVFAWVYEVNAVGISRWRDFKIRPPSRVIQSYYYNQFSSVYVNGALHWLVKTRHNNGRTFSYYILSFNLEDHKFRELPLPSQVHGFFTSKIIFDPKLTEFNGMLCVCARTCEFYWCFHMWVMKVYGQQNSWIPLVDISVPVPNGSFRLMDLKDNNGEEFWFRDEDGDLLCVFNKRTRKIKKCTKITPPHAWFRGTYVHSIAFMKCNKKPFVW